MVIYKKDITFYPKVLIGPLVDPRMPVQLSQLDHQQGPPRPTAQHSDPSNPIDG